MGDEHRDGGQRRDQAWRAALLDALRDAVVVLDESGAVIEVNDGFVELLGYGPEGLPYRPPMPWWPHLDDRADPAEQRGSGPVWVRSGQRGLWRAELRHRDGHMVWVESSAATIEADSEGGPQQVAIMRDVTAQHRANARDRVLAESGRLLTQPGDLDSRLDALATGLAAVARGLVVLARTGPDGLMHPLAAAHPSRPELAAAALAAAPARVPESALEAHRAGRAFIDRDGTMVGPISAAGRVLGQILIPPRERPFDRADLELIEELARRIAGAQMSARASERERRLHDASAALSAAATVGEAAEALAVALHDALQPIGIAVYIRRRDDPTRLHLAHCMGYPSSFIDDFAVIDAEHDLFTAEVLRTGQALWLHDRGSWQHRYPQLTQDGSLGEVEGGMMVPLRMGDEIVGVVGAVFATERNFPEDERNFVRTLVGQAAQAFERAALTDAHRQIARILQQRLLPQQLPSIARLTLAAHYESAGEHVQAGGDWYDVIPLSGSKVGIVVGDVVGHGATAAAIMGQLRASLAAYLLEGHPPAQALRLLTRVARRIDGALASTAVCLVLDTATGELCWSAAGHPPPLLLDPGDAEQPVRYLAGARGGVLGTGTAGGFTLPYTEARLELPPGASVLLYTDGLVERRHENMGAGLDRLARAVARHRDADPDELLRKVLAEVPSGAGPDDDVALVVARLEPARVSEPVSVRSAAEPAPNPSGRSRSAPATHGLLQVLDDPGGGLTLRLVGALDLAAVEPVRLELLRLLDAGTGPVTIDTAGVTYLGSVGIRLLAEVLQLAAERVRFRVEPGSVAANTLAISGFELAGVEATAPPP